MYWAIGYDERWNRDVGFDVPGICDHPGCKKELHRGIDHVCGGEPYGGDLACGLYFCKDHLEMKQINSSDKPIPVCSQCSATKKPFHPTNDTQEWVEYKQTSNYWAGWRTHHEKKRKAKAC